MTYLVSLSLQNYFVWLEDKDNFVFSKDRCWADVPEGKHQAAEQLNQKSTIL